MKEIEEIMLDTSKCKNKKSSTKILKELRYNKNPMNPMFDKFIENHKESDRKNKAGEPLNFSNYFWLLMEITYYIISIAIFVMIIKLVMELW